jgi:hypothetical protein
MSMSSFITRRGPLVLIGSAALVAAGIGGAAAQEAINGRTIVPGTVGTTQLAKGAVSTAKIRVGAVGQDQLANGGVARVKLRAGAIGPEQLDSGAVSAAAIASGAIGTSALQAKAVTRAKLAKDARVPRVITRFAQGSIPANQQVSVTAKCLKGEVLIGGGYGGLPTSQSLSGGQAGVLASRPEPDVQSSTPIAWRVVVDNHSPNLASATAYALCAIPG